MKRWRLWCYRGAAAVLAPVIAFAMVELTLRVCGFGCPTSFLLPVRLNGEEVWVQNNQFTRRYFPPQMARTPVPFTIPRAKPPGTVRVFVFGESAAQGDPQPRFGLPRLIEAQLRLRHPGMKFEVVNAAVTAINSHCILPIARDCARADGDIWVIYMGNNEVVGPFGPGTVFGARNPPLALARASTRFKATRTGQWFAALIQKLQAPPPDSSEWGGMRMFLENQVGQDDPRLEIVYHHFARNLADIIRAGQRGGAGIVVSTVAVNLKDCAPFGSGSQPGIPESSKAAWAQLHERGVVAQEAGDLKEAGECFDQAARIDESVATLRFRQGVCALDNGQPAEAQNHLRAALDLDTLRFRCDSRLNEVIRKLAVNRATERVRLADAERYLAGESADGLPGAEWFYDHVHLTFPGNYAVARAIVAEIEGLLPERLAASRDANPWPSIEECVRHLAWTDWTLQAAITDVLARVAEPPFTGQLNHAAQVQSLTAMLLDLSRVTQSGGLDAAGEFCEAAVAAAPDDPWLRDELAALKQLTDDLPGAETEARLSVQLLPSNGPGWSRLGQILAQQQKFSEAIAAFERALEWDHQDVWTLRDVAESMANLGRLDAAQREYRRALKLKPRFGPAWLGLGKLLEEMGRQSEADDCYREGLANRLHSGGELAILARFCQSRGWHEAALTNYTDAIKLSPVDASLHIEAGQCHTALGRTAEAAEHYADAVRLAPGMVQARFLHGVSLGREGKTAEATAQFREVVRLSPDLIEGRLNLAISLANQGLNQEAIEEFGEVLRRSPTNAVALEYVEALRAKAEASESGH